MTHARTNMASVRLKRLCRKFFGNPGGFHKRPLAFFFIFSLVIFCQVLIVSREMFYPNSEVRRYDSTRTTTVNNTKNISNTLSLELTKHIAVNGRTEKGWKAKSLRNSRRHGGSEDHTINQSSSIHGFINVNDIIVSINRTLNETAKPTLDHRIVFEYWPTVEFKLLTPVITPIADDNEYFVVIMIHSGVHSSVHLDRRNAIRRTWGNGRRSTNDTGSKVDSLSFKLVFLLGKSYDKVLDDKIATEAKLYNDIVVGDFHDNYTNLIIKVYMGFKWIQENMNSKFVIKADDDLYLYLPRLTHRLAKAGPRFFGGLVWKDAPVFRSITNKHAISMMYYSEKRYPPYCGGGFYAFTKNLLPDFIRLTTRFRPFHVEDAYLGILLRHINVRPSPMYGVMLGDWMPSSLPFIKDCEWAMAIAVGHSFNGSHIDHVHSKISSIDPESLTQADWLKCRRRRQPGTNEGNIVAAVCGIFLSLTMIFIYIVVAFLPGQFDYPEDYGFIQNRRRLMPRYQRLRRNSVNL
ncbi:uncharacterized protein LOC116614347 [Nematostella vectensis]|uniref:uncharacterized protein LOC116614347 n=1 Tax=Nematostella vectensis TaxID=45351 RepID=UPI002076E21E|nr:uncharacterized protein LOC116614347 [Nematostella vectensis]